ncbi:thioredoxin fold domain-containing protein [bacterium]|nr:thioredoxin fold domain-containing protein [bacterium]
MDRREFVWKTLVTGGLATAFAQTVQAEEAAEGIPWQRLLKSAHRRAVELDRPLLVIFTASWCTYCHKLIRETSANPKLAQFITANFVPTLLDFDKETRIVEVLAIESLPTTVVLSPQVDLLLHKPGYMKAETFRDTLNAALVRRTEVQQAKAEAAPLR